MQLTFVTDAVHVLLPGCSTQQLRATPFASVPQEALACQEYTEIVTCSGCVCAHAWLPVLCDPVAKQLASVC